MTRNDLKKLLEENQDVNPMVLLTNMSGHWRIWWRHRRFQQSHLLEVQEQGTCVDILNITCIFYAESSLLMHEYLFLHNTCLHFWLGSPYISRMSYGFQVQYPSRKSHWIMHNIKNGFSYKFKGMTVCWIQCDAYCSWFMQNSILSNMN